MARHLAAISSRWIVEDHLVATPPSKNPYKKYASEEEDLKRAATAPILLRVNYKVPQVPVLTQAIKRKPLMRMTVPMTYKTRATR